jgi:hypothetical protein
MLIKDGVAYLQAGVRGRKLAFDAQLTIGQGGIVFDSDPYDEWMETINKLGGFISLFRYLFHRLGRRILIAFCMQVRTRTASPQLRRSIWPSRRMARASMRHRSMETMRHVSRSWLGSCCATRCCMCRRVNGSFSYHGCVPDQIDLFARAGLASTTRAGKRDERIWRPGHRAKHTMPPVMNHGLRHCLEQTRFE